MATHSSALAWRIPWREEPGGLQSTGLQIVGHDWATSLSLSSLENITNIYLKMQSPHTLAGLCNICYCCCSVTESYTTHCGPMNYIQHTILPCPSLFPRVCLNSCPLSWWWTTIHPSVSPSPPAFNPSQHQGLFQWVSSLHQMAKVLELQHQSFQWILRFDWLVWSPCCQRDSQESSPAPQFKSINSSAGSLLYGLTSVYDYWKSNSFD